jgi:hypothetical protein
MNRRQHGSRPTLALWMLVAVADAALLVAAAGPVLILLIVAGLVTGGGAFAGFRMLTHRHAAGSKVAVRKRA